jgi:hypothetical protein
MCSALVAASLQSDQFQQLVPADLAKRNAAIEKHAKDVKTLVDLIVKAINAKKLNLVYTQRSLLEAQVQFVNIASSDADIPLENTCG